MWGAFRSRKAKVIIVAVIVAICAVLFVLYRVGRYYSDYYQNATEQSRNLEGSEH